MTDGELVRRIRLGEDSVLALRRVLLEGNVVVAPFGHDLADELSAFANTGGGTVLLGVDDRTGQVRGIPSRGLKAVEAWVGKSAIIRSPRPGARVFRPASFDGV